MALDHPHILACLGFSLSPPMLVSDLRGGQTLAAVLAKGLQEQGVAAQLTWQRRLRMVRAWH